MPGTRSYAEASFSIFTQPLKTPPADRAPSNLGRRRRRPHTEVMCGRAVTILPPRRPHPLRCAVTRELTTISPENGQSLSHIRVTLLPPPERSVRLQAARTPSAWKTNQLPGGLINFRMSWLAVRYVLSPPTEDESLQVLATMYRVPTTGCTN